MKGLGTVFLYAILTLVALLTLGGGGGRWPPWCGWSPLP